MMALSDRTFGSLLLLSAGTFYVYYTVWTLILPFFDSSSPLHSWFPSREWAVRVPAFIIVLGLSAIGVSLGWKILVHPRPHQTD